MSTHSFAVGQRVTTGDGTGKGVEGVIHAVHGPGTYSVRIGSQILVRDAGYLRAIVVQPQAFAVGQTVGFFKHPSGGLRTGYIRRVTGTNLYEVELPSGARFLRPAEDLRHVGPKTACAQALEDLAVKDAEPQSAKEPDRFHFVIDIKREGEGLHRQVRATCGEFANVSNTGERALVAKLMTLEAIAEVPEHAAHKLLLEAGLDMVVLVHPHRKVVANWRAGAKRAHLHPTAIHHAGRDYYRLTVELPT